MAVTLESGTGIKRFRGLSTDAKPQPGTLVDGETLGDIKVGSIFTELDTGERYVWGGTWPWVRQEQSIEVLFANLMDVNERILAYLRATHKGNELHLWGEDVEVDPF